jgi:hypothetical protein
VEIVADDGVGFLILDKTLPLSQEIEIGMNGKLDS